jgi:hypothetical protein
MAKITQWGRFKRWRKARVRYISFGKSGDNYFRYAPNWGFAFPWFKSKHNQRRRRIRAAYHHGVQIVEWRGARWVVVVQVFGKSRVNRESFDLTRPNSRRKRRKRG